MREKEFYVEYGPGPADEFGVPMRGLASYFIDGQPVTEEEFKLQLEEYRKEHDEK